MVEQKDMEEQQSIVKESLFLFMKKNVPNADENLIDDIVLRYVISILEEASNDPYFDVEGFMEMMAAYVPEFGTLEPGLVLSWILEMEADLSQRSSDTASNDESTGSDKGRLTLSEMLPTNVAKTNSRSNSECDSTEERHSAIVDSALQKWPAECQHLAEMFPDTCSAEIQTCVSIAWGDVERAACTLLTRREEGQSFEAHALLTNMKQPQIDDQELKSRIIARYSYVDKSSDSREHRPLAPKNEPKKMVRYRDNKIVSLKGERYTEVPKSGDEENLKKPKKQHSP